jgi:hypothetical protein
VDARRSIDDTLAVARGRIKRARRRAEADSRMWVLPPHIQRASLIMFMLADYDTEPAVNYVAARARERHWPPRTAEVLATLVEDLFLQADANELAALADTSNADDPAALSVATKCVEEWRVVVWVRGLNAAKGVAPSTESVLHQAEARRMELPEAVRGPPRGAVGESRARRWVARLRKRWAGRFGKVRVRDELQPSEIHNKARAKGLCEPIWVPKMWTSRASFRSQSRNAWRATPRDPALGTPTQGHTRRSPFW